MTELESHSFLQCLKVLSAYDIYLVAPIGLDLSSYTVNSTIKAKRFDPSYFSGIAGYNRLMLSNFFYNSFIDYDYILIYQLDSWVFKDELSYWCKLGYDYVGAPWIDIDVYRWLHIKNLYPTELKVVHRIGNGRFLSKVGNGGFSLRKVKSMMYNLNLFSYRSKTWRAYEDSFFCHYVSTFNIFFRTPSLNKALKFSFDANPASAYEANNFELPFGCHAFNRSDPPFYGNNVLFWKDHIPFLSAKT